MKAETTLKIGEGAIAEIIAEWLVQTMPNVTLTDRSKVRLAKEEWFGVCATITVEMEIESPKGGE